MKLSIITINYNNLEGLKKTAESVMNQTWRDFEWILIDGGSTDGGKEYIENLAAVSGNNISYWCSERDKGIYNAMNKGIAKANGDYVICMNSGDTFHAECTLQLVFSREYVSDVLYGDWDRVYHDKTEHCFSPHKMSPMFFCYSNICHQAMFVKTELLKEDLFDESYKIYADWKKWRDFNYQHKSFEYIPIVVCDFDADTCISDTPSIQIIETKMLYESLPAEIQYDITQIQRADKELNQAIEDLGSRIIFYKKRKKLYKVLLCIALVILSLFLTFMNNCI